MGTANTNSGLSLQRRKTIFWCWLFMLPAISLFLIFQVYPLFANGYYSLFDWNGIGASFRYIGLRNYSRVLSDSYFWNALGNNYLFMLWVVPLQLVFGLVLALALNTGCEKIRNTYRTAFFIPVICTASVVGIIMSFLLGFDGPVTAALSALGLCEPGQNWISDGDTAMASVIIVYAWKNVGMNMVYWIAALQAVPEELHEAARIDGANGRQTFFHVTLPLIVPTGAVITVMNVISSLKIFDLAKTMTDGGPFFKTDFVSLYMYRYAFSASFGQPRMGYAAAAGMIFGLSAITVAVLVSVCLTHSRKKAA